MFNGFVGWLQKLHEKRNCFTMAIDRNEYPPNWDKISQRILQRDGHQCAECGVLDKAVGYRDAEGVFVPRALGQYDLAFEAAKLKMITIHLSCCHLNHDPENWDVPDDDLASLCQQCHNRYDSKNRARNRNIRKVAAAGQEEMFIDVTTVPWSDANSKPRRKLNIQHTDTPPNQRSIF